RDAEESFFDLLSGQVGRVLGPLGGFAAPHTRTPDTGPGREGPGAPAGGGRADGPEVAPEEATRAAERQRLARDLHDSLMPTLYGIALGAERLTELVHGDAAHEVAQYVRDLATTALGETRALV